MATVQIEKVKEFLTCTICTDEYTDPCTLKCQHSFCRKCVTDYTKTKPEALQSKTIPCPCCRQVTKVPDPTKPVEEWADQIKASIIIQGLIDTAQPVQTTDTGRCCSVCEHVGETTTATSWCHQCEITLCDRCARSHRGTPMSRDHDVCILSEEVMVKVMRRKVMCSEHTDECVKFHCRDCKKSACPTCCIIYHRACGSVVTIESLKSEMKALLNKNRVIMSKKIKVKSVKLTANAGAIKRASQNKTTMKSQIRFVSQTAIDNIKQKEKQLMDKLDEVTEKQISKLQADVKTEEIEMQMYKQHCEFIDQTLISDCVMDMYDLYQACESGALVLGDDRDSDAADRQRIDGIRFTHGLDSVQSVLDDVQLGEIDVTYQDVFRPLSFPVLTDTTDIKTEIDRKDPYLIDVVVLHVDGVQTAVVTIFKTNGVKSLYTKGNRRCHSILTLDKLPYGVTQLKENQVMVTVPNSHQIVTIRVTPELELLSTISTTKSYHTLSVLKSTLTLVAGCVQSEACVDILNIDGEILRSVSSSSMMSLFEFPWYLCVNNKGNILVCDKRKKSVICLTSVGDVLWRYSPTGDQALSMPRGITAITGGVLVADREPSRVIELTDTGEYVRDVLTSQNGITSPRGLAFDDYGSLFLCDGGVLHEYNFT